MELEKIWSKKAMSYLVVALVCTALIACGKNKRPPLPDPVQVGYEYLIGPGDSLNIFVWRNPELSQTASVRPDGKISVPLVEDLDVSGKTSTELAREIEEILSRYVRDPLVTVIVGGFVGPFGEQVRVLGEAVNPRAIPFVTNMTALDVMIQVGGLTDFAAGNRTRLIRKVEGEELTSTVRLEDLLQDGDISANVKVAPGDVFIIPQAWF